MQKSYAHVELLYKQIFCSPTRDLGQSPFFRSKQNVSSGLDQEQILIPKVTPNDSTLISNLLDFIKAWAWI